jgi:hypothetical protein
MLGLVEMGGGGRGHAPVWSEIGDSEFSIARGEIVIKTIIPDVWAWLGCILGLIYVESG